MHAAFIPFGSSQVHYHYGGDGDHILICFHGYGESGNSFRSLAPLLPGYRLFAVDMPYSGKTEWKEGLNFTPQELLQIVDQILSRHHNPGASFTLLGFSMGGRIALSLLEVAQPRVQKLVLLAPDGLQVNFWYRLATGNTVGNRLFRYTMKNPQWLFLTLHAGKATGIIDKSVYRFICHYIHNAELRQLLYRRWTCMRHFKPDLTAIKNGILHYRIPVQIVFGQYDRIFRPRQGEKFRKGIESFCTLHTVQTGHQILQPKHAGLVAGFIPF